MRYLRILLAGVAIALLLAGCPDDDDGGGEVPVAANDAASTVPNLPITIDVTANDTDADGTIDSTTVTIVTGPSDDTANVNAITGVVTYTPDADFVGTDTFTYTANDNEGNTSNVATVTVTVTTTPDFVNFVQQLLAIDANTEPVPINTLSFENQLATGDAESIDSFLP